MATCSRVPTTAPNRLRPSGRCSAKSATIVTGMAAMLAVVVESSKLNCHDR
jgi:hypothetical protein